MIRLIKLEKHCNCGAILEFSKEDIVKRNRHKIDMVWTDIQYIEEGIYCPVCGAFIVTKRNL